MLAHISGTSSKGSCTARKWVGRESLFPTLLLMTICHGLGVQEWSSHQPGDPVPPAISGPCLSQWYLPRQAQAGWHGRGALGWPGRGMQGCSHPLPAHSSEGGEEQAAAELRQLLGNSPANLHPVRKHFFQRFRWVSQARDQAWLIRWF